MQALRGLKSRLSDMLAYLEAVVEGKLPVNNEIIGLLQDIFNLLPNLNLEALSQSLTGAHHIMSVRCKGSACLPRLQARCDFE